METEKTGSTATATGAQETPAGGQQAPTTDYWSLISNAPEFKEEPQAPAPSAGTGSDNSQSHTGQTDKTKSDDKQAESTSVPGKTDDKTAASGENSTTGETTSTTATGDAAAAGDGKEGQSTTAATDKPVLEISPDDIKDVPVTTDKEKQEAPEGSWLHVAQAEGIEVKEDSWEAVKAAVIAPYQKENQELKTLTLDTYLGSLKPEAAAAIKLIEMGHDPEKYYQTQQNLNNALAMEDAALIRKDLEYRADEGWDEARIDAFMEDLSAKPESLKIKADIIRIDLNNTKKELLNTKTTLIQQFEEGKKVAAQQQQAQRLAQVKTALDTVSEFMGAPVSATVRERIFSKYSAGHYENVLKDPKLIAESILFHEVGQKLIASLRNTAFETGRDEKEKKLSNIPPVTQAAGSVVKPNQSDDYWSILKDAPEFK